MYTLIVDRDWKGKSITPRLIRVDSDVQNRIFRERIVVGSTPNNTLVVISRNGKSASQRNGGRSFLKVITNEDGWKRVKTASRDDYTRSALYKPATTSSTRPPPSQPKPVQPIPAQPQPQRDPPTPQPTPVPDHKVDPKSLPLNPKPKSVVQLHMERMQSGLLGRQLPPPPPQPVAPIFPVKRTPLSWPDFRSVPKSPQVSSTPTNTPNELKVVLSNGDTVYGSPDAIALFTAERIKQKHR